jgi:hypothetical protein
MPITLYCPEEVDQLSSQKNPKSWKKWNIFCVKEKDVSKNA